MRTAVGQRLQSDQRIVHDQKRVGMRQVEQVGYFAAGNHCCASTALECGGNKVMSVIALAADGEKQISRRERAGVDGISRRRLPGADHPHAACSSAPIQRAMSCKLQLHWLLSGPQYLPCDGHIIERYHPFADGLSFFVSFAGQKHQVTRLCLSNGQFDGVTAIWFDDHRSPECSAQTREAPGR